MIEQLDFEFKGGGEGLQLKQAGIEQVSSNEAAAWKDRIAGVIRGIATEQERLTSDDVRARAEQEGIPEPHHPNAWGAAMYHASGEGIIVSTGNYLVSSRPLAHGRPISIWQSKIFAGGVGHGL